MSAIAIRPVNQFNLGKSTTRTPSLAPTPVAVLDNITKRYQTIRALDGLSLTLHAGEVVALLGPNGAGKSTAIRLMLGLSTPTSRQVRIFGSDARLSSHAPASELCSRSPASPRLLRSMSILIFSAATTLTRCPLPRLSA